MQILLLFLCVNSNLWASQWAAIDNANGQQQLAMFFYDCCERGREQLYLLAGRTGLKLYAT